MTHLISVDVRVGGGVTAQEAVEEVRNSTRQGGHLSRLHGQLVQMFG